MNSQPPRKALITSVVCALPSTATRIETPSAKPICRVIVNTAEPVANRAGGRDAAAALASEGSVSPTPVPVMIWPGSISLAYEGVAPRCQSHHAPPAANSVMPAVATRRWPKRPASRPPGTAVIAAIAGPGISDTPACRTE